MSSSIWTQLCQSLPFLTRSIYCGPLVVFSKGRPGGAGDPRQSLRTPTVGGRRESLARRLKTRKCLPLRHLSSFWLARRLDDFRNAHRGSCVDGSLLTVRQAILPDRGVGLLTTHIDFGSRSHHFDCLLDRLCAGVHGDGVRSRHDIRNFKVAVGIRENDIR